MAYCAWCKAFLGFRPGPANDVTHSICRDCSARELAKIGLVVARDANGVARPQPLPAAPVRREAA